MKISSFNLSWYGQWPLEHRSCDEWSRPGLTNGWGSLQVSGDPTSLRHLVFPPVSSAEESTAFLTLDDTLLAATSTVTSVTWLPWSVNRRATFGNWEIESQVCLPPETPGALLRVNLRNRDSQPRHLRAGLRLSGRCVNRGLDPWFWGIPGISTQIVDFLGESGLKPIREICTDGLLFRDRGGEAASAQMLNPAPDFWAGNGDATWQRTLAPGESLTIHLAIILDPESSPAEDRARALLQDPERAFAGAESFWRQLWHSAFHPGGPLSGSLPDLDLPENLLPVAASSVLCLLLSRRTHRVGDGRVKYNISTPRRVEACFYPNDWGLASRALAQMDPDATWNQLAMATRADVRRFNQINHFTGRGGDAQGHGWPYTIDIFNLFYAAWHLWQTSDGAAPEALRDRQLPLPDGRQVSLLDVLEDLAFDWRNRRASGRHLADYGARHELLECVTTYAHVVAGLNAGAAWMLRRLANAYRALGRTEQALAVDLEADRIVSAILSELYVEGSGWFRCLHQDGSAHEVRHCWDTGMVLTCIGPELPAKVQAEIVAFFARELRTPSWLRALSPLDGDAAISGQRADHQCNGAYGAWPAQVALGLLRIGQADLVHSWMDGISRTARQGPFGQAHYDETATEPVHGGAAKATDELPQCCHWSNLSGGLFFSVLEEGAGNFSSA